MIAKVEYESCASCVLLLCVFIFLLHDRVRGCINSTCLVCEQERLGRPKRDQFGPIAEGHDKLVRKLAKSRLASHERKRETERDRERGRVKFPRATSSRQCLTECL